MRLIWLRTIYTIIREEKNFILPHKIKKTNKKYLDKNESNEIKNIEKRKEEGLKKIFESKEKVNKLRESIMQNILEIGAELNKVKSEKLYLWKYNLWREYLEKEVYFNEKTAKKCMRLADEISKEKEKLEEIKKQ